MLAQLVSDPNEYFKREARFGGWKKPIIVVTLVGIAYSMYAVSMYLRLGDQFGEVQDGWTVILLREFFHPIALWFVVGLAVYVIARILGGRPTSAVVRVSGVAFLPLILAGISKAIGLYIALGGISRPEDVTSGYIEFEYPALLEYESTAFNDPIFLLFTLLSFVFLFVTAYLLVFAVKHASELDRQQAIAAVAVPTVGYALYILADIL